MNYNTKRKKSSNVYNLSKLKLNCYDMEKQELLTNLRSRIIYKDKELTHFTYTP